MSSIPLARDTEYLRNWDALGELIKRGNSFSGRERNCVFLNTGGPRFADISAVTQFDFPDDSRAVGLTDWDHDGDVDMWLANRTAPRLRLLRNDLPSGNRYVALQLVGATCNRDAIGARVELNLSGGSSRRLIDTVRAGDGFLTQSTKVLHFGVGQDQRIEKLRIRWPGETGWEEFGELEANARYRIAQGSGIATRMEGPEPEIALASSQPKSPDSTGEARVVLTSRVALPFSEYLGFDGQRKPLREDQVGPVLLNLWASWCRPCVQELTDFAQRRQSWQDAGLTVLPLCTDQLGDVASKDISVAEDLLKKIGFS